MGIFDALNTSVAGLQAQSFALQNISGNIANAQTTGYKGVGTSFVDLVPDSTTPNRQVAGAVTAYARATISSQGTVSVSTVATYMAINGDGFFSVQKASGITDNVPVCNVIAPVAGLMVGATPVIVPIFASRVPTVSVISIELPAVPVLTNVRVVPSTTMVSPTAKFVVSELLGDAPDSVVAAVIGTGAAALFKAAEPVTVASPNGIGGVPTGNGFWLKSEGFKPPAAVIVPAAAVLLAGVLGVVGRLAAY